MRCTICQNGETEQKPVSELFERDGRFVIIHGIPAEVCQNCGEVYFDAEPTARLLEIVEEALKNGDAVAVESYSAA